LYAGYKFWPSNLLVLFSVVIDYLMKISMNPDYNTNRYRLASWIIIEPQA